MLVYLDAAPVIYEVEHAAGAIPAALRQAGFADAGLVASDLTRLECRTQPIQRGNESLLSDFDQFFAETVGLIVTLDTAVVDCATQIRAVHGLKTADALHLAAALVSGCDAFLTNDLRLARTEVSLQFITVVSPLA
jgi:uncharacterized protein